MARAESFVVDDITYIILDGNSVAVTAPETDKYTGAVIIPGTIEYGGNSYNVTEISDRAFYTCNQLTQVSLPSTITKIGEYAFSGCTSLKNVSLPNGITTLEDGIFYGCWSITNITIPSTVTSIGEKAFFNCIRLTTVTLQEGLTMIGEFAFDHCSNLSNITLPKSLRILRGHAFNYCSKLQNISIPENVYQIDTDPFASCTALEAIGVDDGNTRFTSVDGVLLDANCQRLVCFPCGKKGGYVMPKTVKTIDDQAFCNRKGLTSITLSPALTTIGTQTFYGCSQLTELRFPASMLEIGIRAMREMTALNRVFCYAKTPPNIYNTTFGTATNESVILYVPQRAVEEYRNNGYWGRFKNILPIEERVDIPDVAVFAGTRTDLQVDLNVAEPVKSLTFNLVLPNGIKPATNGSRITLAKRFSGDGVTATVEPAGDGRWHVECQCSESNTITWGDGLLMTIGFDVDSEMEDCYDGSAENVVVTYADDEVCEIEGTDFEVCVETGLLGDADNSGDVSLTDVMLTVSYILEGMPQGVFYFPLADVDRSGDISLADIMGIVSIILNE